MPPGIGNLYKSKKTPAPEGADDGGQASDGDVVVT